MDNGNLIMTHQYETETGDALEVSLENSREEDDIRIHFDFIRNGWVICLATIFEWEEDDEEEDRGWQEVAFIQVGDRR